MISSKYYCQYWVLIMVYWTPYQLLNLTYSRKLCPSGAMKFLIIIRLLDSLVVECWLRVREAPGSIPSQGPRHTKDVIKMVPVVPLFSTEHYRLLDCLVV